MKIRKRLAYAAAISLPVCALACWTGMNLLDSTLKPAMAQSVNDATPTADAPPTTAQSPDNTGPALAQENTAQNNGQSTAPSDSTGRGFGNSRGRMGFGIGLPPQVRNSLLDMKARDDQNWADFMAFAVENSPYRFRLFTRQPPAAFSQQRQRLLQRWQTMQQSKQSQPALYQVQLQQFKGEDDVIGLSAQLRQAKNRQNVALQERLKAQIRNEAGTLIDLDLQERQMRIQNLEATLAQEKLRLVQDTNNRQQRAESRATQIINQTGGAGQ